MFSTKLLLLEITGFPTYIQRTKKKKFHINFNNILKASYRTYYLVKEKYFENVKHMFPRKTISGKVSLVFTFYSGDRGIKDLSNMVSVLDKFISDYLVRLKVLTDDATTTVTTVHYVYGGVVPRNQHVDLSIYREE